MPAAGRCRRAARQQMAAGRDGMFSAALARTGVFHRCTRLFAVAFKDFFLPCAKKVLADWKIMLCKSAYMIYITDAATAMSTRAKAAEILMKVDSCR